MVIVTRRRAVFAFVILLAAGAVVAADEPDIHQEATEAAEAWLELIDAGKYDDSWDTAANYFKSSVRQEKWREMAAAVRGPLGRVLSPSTAPNCRELLTASTS
jgi:hypothetical protein